MNGDGWMAVAATALLASTVTYLGVHIVAALLR